MRYDGMTESMWVEWNAEELAAHEKLDSNGGREDDISEAETTTSYDTFLVLMTDW